MKHNCFNLGRNKELTVDDCVEGRVAGDIAMK